MPTAPLDTSTISRARLAQPRQALDDLHDAPERQLHAVVRDDVRPDLDDDAVRIGQVFAGFGSVGRTLMSGQIYRPSVTNTTPRVGSGL